MESKVYEFQILSLGRVGNILAPYSARPKATFN